MHYRNGFGVESWRLPSDDPGVAMWWRSARLSSVTRLRILVALAVATVASVAQAQATYKLTIFTSAGGYLGTAQVTSSPAGIDCRSESSGLVPMGGTCSADFPAGTTVTLTATPLYGGTFDGWADQGQLPACAGQGSTCQLVMTRAITTSPKTIAKTYTLTIVGTASSNSSGGFGSVDMFARPRLNCEVGPGGVTSGICTTEIPANQWGWVSRDPDHQYANFSGFSGCDPAPGECMVFMDRPRTITAGWTAMEIKIVNSYSIYNGTGKVTGTATNHPIGSFDCTVSNTMAAGTCSAKWEDYLPPMSITLTATPTGNSVFVGWGPGCTGAGSGGNVCVIPLRKDAIEIRALFEVPTYLLSIAAAGTGSGKVVSAPVAFTCTISAGVTNQFCDALIPKGTQITLTAEPTGGSTFGGWSGACSGTQAACVVTVNATTNAIARFVAPRPATELALALLGAATITADEQLELDRFGNKDGTFNLGDLLALLARTGERLSGTTMSTLLRTQRDAAVERSGGRNP